ncbi:malto-oligosyltrehalose trehalohydrolase [Stenotrophomonas sp. CFBP 13718]|uniref:malto-oligosyltrehalose trehalohydrolase n=1 Tax=Stenotrophomonas sp. CFBP 13718 TaxID=2775304 RepID=UPI00177E5420|nr:malto-oligosyltrehalose trehalohydrolase [Stenotrophomonas sp. CFBP 13718]MBD8697692.1 malto-oligosyltrehalose trehalohydrolase [Stenotrophomonas sp. CFBP 13718]
MSVAVAGRLGAWPIGDGCYQFRVWAPDAREVALVLDGDLLQMHGEGDGCFSVDAAGSAGAPYRYRIDGDEQVPDPASRWQPHGVEGASALLPVDGHAWKSGWTGRAWHELVIYEVHLGCSGGIEGLRTQLPALAAMGITALELMPVAQFPGRRNWGYDGVFPYAPAEVYGHPDALKALVDDAHAQGMAVLLDVVYNHFGPQGNLLSRYASAFFRTDAPTPWGEAIDFRQPQVRRFFIDNALMWLQEYRFDGLRLDAVHTIVPNDFLADLQHSVRTHCGADRPIHLVLENERNQAHWLRAGFQAQWNDDYHNALHVMVTGEREGYYADYADRAAELLARSLAEGFGWQGERNHKGEMRGEPSADVSADHFVIFAQNHDQIGNRAFGDRLCTQVTPAVASAVQALTLLTPMVPLVFMGEPWHARQPFQFFTDFAPPLDEAVREGRRREFAGFAAFSSQSERDRIPDPNAIATFERSRVALPPADDALAAAHIEDFAALLAVRRRYLQPALAHARSLGARVLGPQAVQAGWQLPEGQWWVAFNAGPADVAHSLPDGQVLRAQGDAQAAHLAAGGGIRVHWVAS